METKQLTGTEWSKINGKLDTNPAYSQRDVFATSEKRHAAPLQILKATVAEVVGEGRENAWKEYLDVQAAMLSGVRKWWRK